MPPRITVSPLPAYHEGSRSRSVSPGTTLPERESHESKNLVKRGIWCIPETGDLTDSYGALPKVSNIQDLLENIDRTLSVGKPENSSESPQMAMHSLSWKLNGGQRDLGVDLDLDTPNARPRGRVSPGYRERGLSVENVHKLNLAWEEKRGGKIRDLGSSVVTLNSGGGVRREVKFTTKGDHGIENKVDRLSMFHGVPETHDEIDVQPETRQGDESDDAEIELDDTIHNEVKECRSYFGEEVPLQPDTGIAFPQDRRVYDWGAAEGLAEDLRRLSLSFELEDILIPDTSSRDGWSKSGPNRDVVGGLPAWEFNRADLDLFISGPAELEQQEAVFDAYEQGLSPEVLNSGRDDEDGKAEMVGSHLFVFDRTQRRLVNEGGGEEEELEENEIFEGLDDLDGDDIDELEGAVSSNREHTELIELDPMVKGKGKERVD